MFDLLQEPEEHIEMQLLLWMINTLQHYVYEKVPLNFIRNNSLKTEGLCLNLIYQEVASSSPLWFLH